MRGRLDALAASHMSLGYRRDARVIYITFSSSFFLKLKRATMHTVTEPKVGYSGRREAASWFGGRLLIVGAAALGFIVTFVILGPKIVLLKNVMLPLLAFVPVYLLLIVLNMMWVASTVSRIGHSGAAVARSSVARQLLRLWPSVCGLALGALAAALYVHSVSK